MPRRLRLAQPSRGSHGLAVLAALLAAAFVAAPVTAQEERLDKSKLISGLAEEGMDELLGHYLNEVGDDLDPVTRANLEVEQRLMTFRDIGNGWDERKDALNSAIDAKRGLVEDNAEHAYMVPIWQTELAELLLFAQISVAGRQSEMFIEFGIPDQEQRQIFHESAALAYELAANANDRFFDLSGKLARDEALRNELEESGVMFDKQQFEEARTPIMMAVAAYYTTLLPDDHPYFANIAAGKRNPMVPAQANSIVLERSRLLNDAYDAIEPFASDTSDPFGIRKTIAMPLAGRIEAARGNGDEGIDDWLRPIANDGQLKAQPINLTAELAIAFAEASRGAFGEAEAQLGDLESHPLVEGNALYRLLLADAAHRIIQLDIEAKPADQQAVMLPRAYQPYLDMLDAMDGDARAGMQGYVFTRWEESIPADADISGFPAMVRLAVAELALARAQNAVAGIRLQVEGSAEKAEEQFARAIAAGESLTGEDVPEQFRARGTVALAIALAKREEAADEQDVAVIMRVIDLTRGVADAMPDQKVSEDAIHTSIFYARKLHDVTLQGVAIPGAEEAYSRSAQVLFTRYDTLPVADEQRVHYAMHFLKPIDAIEQYGQVPFDSPDYYLAQRERLFSMESLWEAEESEAGKELSRQTLQDAADALAEEAQRDIDRGEDASRVIQAKLAQGVARIVQASLATQAANYDAAIELLEGFETDYADVPDYVPDAIERRIMAMVDADRLDDAAAEARKMMQNFPQNAAAIISEVLDGLESEIDTLGRRIASETLDSKRAQFEQQRSEKAQVAVKLSEVLLEWAKGQGFGAEQMLPYRLPVIKALRLSGKPDEALGRITPLAEEFPTFGILLYEKAEAHYALGDEENLRAARPLYIRLIGGLEKEGGPMYWRSWVRVLSIADKLQEGTDKITGSVRRLRELRDKELGGPEFKGELEQLEAKYASQG